MSSDSLVYDMSQTSEAKADVMVKRDWLNIQDSNNGNYQGQQSVIDTSQLANSNKYMSYREAYLSIPMVMTATSGTDASPGILEPATATSSADMAFGLKNWTGSLIHSMVLDLAGTTIVQQTPLCSIWQSFVLMTTLSLQDVVTNGAQMGFYPDDALAWQFRPTNSGAGIGTCNNNNSFANQVVYGSFNQMRRSNVGFRERQNYFALDPAGQAGGGASTYESLLSTASMNQLYKSYIFTKLDPDGAGQRGVIQYAIQGILQLKHMHNFFQQVPLVKGLFFRLTLNLNQPSVIVSGGSGTIDLTSVSAPLGGLSQIMVASAQRITEGSIITNTVTYSPATPFVAGASGGTTTDPLTVTVASSSAIPSGSSGINWNAADTITISLAVGNKVLNASQSGLAGVANSPLNQSIFLYVPAYTFNPTFEEAYLASPTKSIIYTDIYQYPTATVSAGSNFNFLITNGIANIKSVLCVPFFSELPGGLSGVKPFQSPFDPAGSGPTSPLALIGNFNVTIAGQNMIYNTQKYGFEQFMNQLQGVNAVNGDLIDGLTSSLVDKLSFEQEYCYYYVNASRMLPVDQSVPKSVQISGQNMSTQEVQYIVFVEYGVQVAVDVLTGSRV